MMTKSYPRLGNVFFQRDALTVARELLGKTIVRRFDDNTEERFTITETEAYLGQEDLACHASKGRTPRTEIMYREGGKIYVYLIYGMYWMLNFVTGSANHPQAVLIRGVGSIIGSGRVGRRLALDKSFYGEELFASKRLWVEDTPMAENYTTAPRVGVDYAGEWKDKPWRFISRPLNPPTKIG
jgi:DNA-3-methyladenine glycosylase